MGPFLSLVYVADNDRNSNASVSGFFFFLVSMSLIYLFFWNFYERFGQHETSGECRVVFFLIKISESLPVGEWGRVVSFTFFSWLSRLHLRKVMINPIEHRQFPNRKLLSPLSANIYALVLSEVLSTVREVRPRPQVSLAKDPMA